jgi:hypothetical protein
MNDNSNLTSLKRNTNFSTGSRLLCCQLWWPHEAQRIVPHSWRISFGGGRGAVLFWADQYSGFILVDTPIHFGLMSIFIYYDLEYLLVFASCSTVPEEVVLCFIWFWKRNARLLDEYGQEWHKTRYSRCCLLVRSGTTRAGHAGQYIIITRLLGYADSRLSWIGSGREYDWSLGK